MTKHFDFVAIGVAAAIAVGVAVPAAAQMAKHDQVQIISGSPTGSWFPISSAAAELTNAMYEGQPISVVPGAGGVGNPLRVGTGQSDIGISYGPFLKLATQGSNDLYTEFFPKLRAIAGMTSNKLHLIGDANAVADLAKLAEMKPKIRVGTGPKGSTELFTMSEVLNAYGVTFDDVESWGGRVDQLNTGGRTDAWNNRQLDMVNYFINDPAARVIELMSGRGGSTLLDVNDKIANLLVEKWGMIEFTIPANSYPGQTADVRTVGMPFVFFATTDLDDDLVYNYTKSIAENHEKLKATHSAFNKWKPDDMPHGLGIELHDGAKKYYKERGWIM